MGVRALRTTRRPSRLVTTATLVAALAAGLAGCGDDGAVVTATPATSSAAPQTSLTIAVDAGDGGPPVESTLACEPAGGTHPDPEAACAALADLDAEAFMPVAADQMCTQIYGGPETATVRGTWRGAPVDASFSREDGCEIARWDAVAGLLA
jgi:Subtilisin inhibitor-like